MAKKLTKQELAAILADASAEDLAESLAEHKEKLLAVDKAARDKRKKERDKKKKQKEALEAAVKTARDKLNKATSQIRGILEKAGVSGKIMFDLGQTGEGFFKYPVRTSGGGKRGNGATLTPDKHKEIKAAVKAGKLDGIPKGLIGQFVCAETPTNGNGNVSEKAFEEKAREILGDKVATDLFSTVENGRIIGNVIYKWNKVHAASYKAACEKK